MTRGRLGSLALRRGALPSPPSCRFIPAHENKQDYLDYPEFLSEGWPVASGLIEGAARWLIKDRMEITGARWGLDSAEAVLKLRALVGCGDFDDYAEYHIRQEKLRNHDSLYRLPEVPAEDIQPRAA
jgi:hypothetical protein